jgi:hypothetical protein
VSTSWNHVPLDVLLDDWLGESDEPTREAVDAHLMACDTCGALLDEVIALGQGVRDVLQAGRLFTVTTSRFVDRLAARGMRVRQYRVPLGGSVNCTVAPGDEVLVSRLQAPLGGVKRLDLVGQSSLDPSSPYRAEDIPFDPATGEVLYMVPIARVRQLPAHTMNMTLVATDDRGAQREVGRYAFHHSPWAS